MEYLLLSARRLSFHFDVMIPLHVRSMADDQHFRSVLIDDAVNVRVYKDLYGIAAFHRGFDEIM